MLCFCDTEFTDFIDTRLISIGLVTEDGREFYAEISDYDRAAESQFVKEHIVPLLGQTIPGVAVNGNRMPFNEAAARLGSWLEELGCPVSVCIDYQADWDLLVDLLDGDIPLNIAPRPVLLIANLMASCVTRCTQRSARYATLGEVAPLHEPTLDTVLKEHRRIFDEGFLEHFFQRSRTDLNYKQHHALYDARANLAGYEAVMNYLSTIFK